MQVLSPKVQDLPRGIPPDCAVGALPRYFGKNDMPGTLPTGVGYTVVF